MRDSAPETLPRYAVVLAAYEGAPHVEAQIESIRAQTAPQWRLYVRDDASRDDTLARITACAAREGRIEIVPGDGRNLGAAASFGVLLQHVLDRGERYVFLCDQDDVWLPDKCERMLRAMLERESEAGPAAPMLVHTDLRVVGEDLSVIHESFVALLRIDSREQMRGPGLLLGNSVTGCASLVNAALLRCALPLPRVAMHDWWLAQCAAAFGDIHFLGEAMVLYRQHGRNVVGARGLGERAATIVRSPAAWWRESARRFLAGLHQLWIIRLRAQQRGLAMGQNVSHSIDVLWRALADPMASLVSRMIATGRSGAMPRSLPMRGLLLARVALLPRLRLRHGDDREGIMEAAS